VSARIKCRAEAREESTRGAAIPFIRGERKICR
jgi:hypothetical protein